MSVAYRAKLMSRLLLGLVMVGMLSACGSVKVKRGSAEEQTELTGRWNANDSSMVATKMINSALDGGWLRRHMRENGGKVPTVIVGKFRNLSHEVINVSTFVADIEAALINSGEVDFVASSKEREQLRGERRDQELNARDDTRKEMGQEIGADFMLIGTLNSFTEKRGGTKNIQYQVDCQLIDMESNRKVWIGSQKHAKTIERSRFGF